MMERVKTPVALRLSGWFVSKPYLTGLRKSCPLASSGSNRRSSLPKSYLKVLLPALRRRSLSQPRSRAWARKVGRSAAATTAFQAWKYASICSFNPFRAPLGGQIVEPATPRSGLFRWTGLIPPTHGPPPRQSRYPRNSAGLLRGCRRGPQIRATAPTGRNSPRSFSSRPRPATA